MERRELPGPLESKRTVPGEEVLQKAREPGHQGLAEAGGGERQDIMKIIRTVSAFHLLTHNKKGLHNRLVNTTFLLHWFPKGLTASPLRDYFQEPGSGHSP